MKDTIITSQQIKKAAAMYDNRMTWEAIADTLDLDAALLQAACEKVANRPLPDRAARSAPKADAGTRVVAGFTITKKEPPKQLRLTEYFTLANAVEAGDCVEGLRTLSAVYSLKRSLVGRGLTCDGRKRVGEHIWDAYIVPAKAKA